MTKEGESFILDLNLYLLSQGKSEKEVKEFIAEAEEHLRLGEEEGKTVKDIFGESPEEYAKSVADEMCFSKDEFFKAVITIMLGMFVWVFFSNIENGTASFTKLEIICTPIIYAVSFILLAIISKKLAFRDKEYTISIFILSAVTVGALVGIRFISKGMPDFITLNRITINIIIALCFIGTLIYCVVNKSYIMFLPFILEAPKLIESLMNLRLDGMKNYMDIVFIILAFVFIKLETKKIMKE